MFLDHQMVLHGDLILWQRRAEKTDPQNSLYAGFDGVQMWSGPQVPPWQPQSSAQCKEAMHSL